MISPEGAGIAVLILANMGALISTAKKVTNGTSKCAYHDGLLKTTNEIKEDVKGLSEAVNKSNVEIAELRTAITLKGII